MNRKGSTALLMVFAVSILAVFLISAWQVRFLYSLNRGRALSEVVALGYHAESKLYDIAARFMGNYPAAFSFPINISESLEDGSTLTTAGVENGSLRTLTVVSKGQFASVRLQISKDTKETAESISKPTEIMLSLDCTASMGSKACTDCSTTRMDEQKKAVLSFLDAVDAHPDKDNLSVGISVFSKIGGWLYTTYTASGVPTGVALKPGSGLTIQQMKDAVNNNINHSGYDDSKSYACLGVRSSTTVGVGFTFMHDYFKTVTGDKKKIEVLITDGRPNQRIKYDGCEVNIDCLDSSTGVCEPYARDFVRCALATTDQVWEPEKKYMGLDFLPGIRDPLIDVYAVTVLDFPPEIVTQIFETYATKYYNIQSADELSEILKDIFGEILTSMTTYTFQRLTPTGGL